MQLQQRVAYAQVAVHGKYTGITEMPTATAEEKAEARRKLEIHNRQKGASSVKPNESDPAHDSESKARCWILFE
jgi:hypothetical protein